LRQISHTFVDRCVSYSQKIVQWLTGPMLRF
jgi:hypothetical protein